VKRFFLVDTVFQNVLIILARKMVTLLSLLNTFDYSPNTDLFVFNYRSKSRLHAEMSKILSKKCTILYFSCYVSINDFLIFEIYIPLLTLASTFHAIT